MFSFEKGQLDVSNIVPHNVHEAYNLFHCPSRREVSIYQQVTLNEAVQLWDRQQVLLLPILLSEIMAWMIN